MVKLSGRWPDAHQPALPEMLRKELEGHRRYLDEAAIAVDIDVAGELEYVPCGQDTQRALQHVLRLAISRSPRHGEIQITACYTQRGVEIEVADSGDDEAALPRFNAFAPRECSQVIDCQGLRRGIGIFATACPQGGMAWTIVVAQRQAAQRVA